MSQNVAKINAKQIEAAALLAAEELTDQEIADQLGINRRTLDRWKLLPDVLHLISEHNERVQAAMLRLDIAKRHKRVAILNDQQDKMLQIMDERAAHYREIDAANGDGSDHAAIARVAAQMFGTTDETTVPPGGTTGMIVRQLKMVGSGMTAKIVEEFAFDHPLHKALLANQEQAAKELGQWVEKSEQTGKTTSKIEIVGIDAGDI